MASNIDIKNSPPTYAPVYNRIEFCVEETDFLPSSKTNFKYIFTVSVSTLYNGVTPSDVKFYVNAQPDTITAEEYGVKDIARYLDQYMKYRIPIPEDSNSFNAVYKGQEQFIIEYSVNIKSGWDVAGVFTEDPDGTGGTNSGTLYAWNGAFEYHEWIRQINLGSPFDTWICNTTNGTDAKFLTNYPNKKVQREQLGWTYYLTDTLTDIDQMEINTYDSSGTLISTFVADYTDPQTDVVERLGRIPTAPGSLNLIPNVLLSTGAQPIITSSVFSYDVQLQNSAGTACSEIATFTIEEPCRYEVYPIHFLNQLGGFDYYNFTSYSKESTTARRKTYTRQEYRFDSTDGLVYNNIDNGKSDYIVKYRDKIKLKSDYLTNEEMEWLKELMISRKLYLQFNQSGLIRLQPVYMVTSNWKKLTIEHDKLFQLEMEIELAHENIGQRG